MKYFVFAFLTVLSLPAFAQQYGQVSSEGSIQIINVQPRFQTIQQKQCRQEQVASNNSGTGTVIGGVAGGIIGNQVGKGTGKDAATILGAIVGASVGNRIGSDQQNVEMREVCNYVPVTTQTGEIVTFMYKGKRYSFEAH